MTQRAPLATAAVLIAFVKCIQFAIDSQTLFFYDSGAFVLNAMGLAFLPYRSYVYGALLRLFAVPFHSLRAIVAMQIVMGGLSAWLLAVALLRFLQVRASIAILAALVFALDPVQIVHEHLVMAETAALLAMALFLLAALRYLEDPAPQWLVVLSLLGILLVSLRIVYLPVVLAAAVLLPVFAYLFSPGLRPRVLAIALVVSCGSAALFHLGYRQLTGRLAGREPAYHYMTGFFLVSSVAPLLEPRDAGDVRVANAILAQNKSGVPLVSRAFRSDQLWAEDGFVARLRAIFNGDEGAADRAAQRLARAAIERDPLGFVKLGVLNYLGFWGGLRYLGTSLQWENGSQLPAAPIPHDAAVIRSVFRADVSNQYALLTLSRRYHLSARYWTVFLLASPFLAGLALWLGPANPRGMGFLLCWNCLLLAATCLGAVGSAYRFLHPFSWTGLAAAAVLCEILVSRRSRSQFRRT